MKTKIELTIRTIGERIQKYAYPGVFYRCYIDGRLYFDAEGIPHFINGEANVHLKKRSYKHLKTYIWAMYWLENNEQVGTGFFDYMTYNAWHTAFKEYFGVKSISYKALDHDDFFDYTKKVFEYIELKTGASVKNIKEDMGQLSESKLREIENGFKL